jgi:hypothetical protein
MMKKKVLYAVSALLLLLIITNPNIEEFRSYLHQTRENAISGRDVNFFIFSFYSDVSDYADSPRNGRSIRFRYIGILGNFFPIGTESFF